MPGSFYFDPDGTGLTVFLGPTESRLMELAWKYRALTVKKAVYFLGGNGKLAYTTVMTILSRLAQKGLLKRTKTGKAFTYEPAIEKDAFLAARVRRVTSCLKRNFSV